MSPCTHIKSMKKNCNHVDRCFGVSKAGWAQQGLRDRFCFPLITTLAISFVSHGLRTSRSIFVSPWLRSNTNLMINLFPIDCELRDQFCSPLITNLAINFVSHGLRTSRRSWSVLFPLDYEPRDQFCFHLVVNHAINFVIHSHPRAESWPETQEHSYGDQHIRNSLVIDVQHHSTVFPQLWCSSWGSFHDRCFRIFL